MFAFLERATRRGVVAGILPAAASLLWTEAEAGDSQAKARRRKKRKAQARVNACYRTFGEICADETGELWLFCTDLMRTCCPRAAQSTDAVCYCMTGTPCNA